MCTVLYTNQTTCKENKTACESSCSVFSSIPAVAVGWNQLVYKGGSKPLLVDLGSGKGWFCRKYAEKYPEWNVLGLEIRELLVERAMNWNQGTQKLFNLHYMFCNINVSLESILKNAVDCNLQRLSIQFPDPHFKRRHYKRRLVTDTLYFFKTDVEQVFLSAADIFVRNKFVYVAWEDDCHPWGVPTERELSCVRHSRRIYRCIFLKDITECKDMK
eukprot:jgi/Galph1/3753/GphlegSOOS_G2434.1